MLLRGSHRSRMGTAAVPYRLAAASRCAGNTAPPWRATNRFLHANPVHPMKGMQPLLFFLAVLGLLLAGCDSGGSDMETPVPPGGDEEEETQSQTEWQQRFDTDTDGWVDNETTGENGWCGSIEHLDAESGPVMPSAGSGYAVVEYGLCNEFWSSRGVFMGGPFAPQENRFDSFPAGGIISELDVYLDPDWEEGSGFDFNIRVIGRGSGCPTILCPLGPGTGHTGHFVLHVAADSSTGGLLVASSEQGPRRRRDVVNVTRRDLETLNHFEVVSAGWYTLRYTLQEDEGDLVVDVQLVHDEEVLFTETQIMRLRGREVLGLLRSWFVFVTDGLRLAIDEHKVFVGE